jgi:hypothetical protein
MTAAALHTAHDRFVPRIIGDRVDDITIVQVVCYAKIVQSLLGSSSVPACDRTSK